MLNQSIIVHGFGEVFSGGSWNPLSLGKKLRAWFDPNVNVYSAPETPCAVDDKWRRWVSVNDSGVFFEQADSGKQLTLREDGNGRRSLEGVGSTADCSVDLVPSHPYGIVMQVQGAGRALSGVANNWLCGSYAPGKHAFYNGEFVANVDAPSGPFVSLAQCNGTDSSLRQNGTDVTSNVTASPVLPGGITIGDGVRNRGENFSGKIGHMVFLKEELTAAEMAILQAFLNP
jgi:hypothetical protein